MVSTHSRPKAAGKDVVISKKEDIVSTHSRPKAAGRSCLTLLSVWLRFNTQPPEGGWMDSNLNRMRKAEFQHTAARRRLGQPVHNVDIPVRFQHTAARRRLAGSHMQCVVMLRFNTQPPEGGWGASSAARIGATVVSTHSRPKAAGKP